MNFSNTQNEILEIEITKKRFLKEKKRKEKIYREKKLNYEEEFSQASQLMSSFIEKKNDHNDDEGIRG